MKCVLSGQNAMILARAIHSFSRIGNELFLEANSKNGLSLRTINMTKSAYSMIVFNLDFFHSFNVKSKSDSFENQCKLSMKSCLGVFRNMKQVESCTISLDNEKCKMIVQFKCRLETIKTHHIPILEHETLQASYVSDKTQNALGGNYKLFSNIVSNFKINEEELSVKATEKEVVIQNYVDGSHVDNRFVRSHITLKPDEFENYKIGEATTITFCMRELRAILIFAEAMNISVSAHFETPGRPIVFVMKNFDTFEANLVMSTLSPEDEEYERQKGRTQSQMNTPNANIDLDRSALNAEEQCENQNESSSSALSSISLRKRNLSNADELNQTNFSVDRHNSMEIMRKRRRTSIQREESLPLPVNDMNNINRTEQSAPLLTETETDGIQVVFEDESHDHIIGPISDELMAWENNDDNTVQENHRDHRPIVREAFKRCFTGNTDPSCNFGEILADCSDEE